MYSLFIDSHDKNVVLILYKNGIVYGSSILESVNKHSQVVMPELKKLLESKNISINDISEIFVCNGPGSFTGERIAVTIAKTIAYSLNIPIKVIDSLTIGALNIDCESKYIYLEDKKGAYVAGFNSNNEVIYDFVYLNHSSFCEFIKDKNVFDLDLINVDYNKVYKFFESVEAINPHSVKPLYVKGISALNDK